MSNAWNRRGYECVEGRAGWAASCLPEELGGSLEERTLDCVLKEEEVIERRKGGARTFQVKEPAEAKACSLT